MGPLDKQVLRTDSLTSSPTGLDLRVYMHWYRALPLTSLARVDLWLDGQSVDPGDIQVTANGIRRPLRETTQLFEEYWFPADPIVLHVTDPGTRGPINAGTHHQVRLDLGLSIPYILIGPQQTPLVAVSSNERTLLADATGKVPS